MSTRLANTRLPAEWEKQSAVLLTWPHGHGDWRNTLQSAERCFLDIARIISRTEQLIIGAYDETHRHYIGRLLAQAGLPMEHISLFVAPSNDSWVRDHGPVTVIRDNKPLLLDFVFNGWGGKYSADLDNRINQTLHKLGAFGTTPIEGVDLVLEGGSIESDGDGTLMTTSQCLLSKTRNPGLGREQIEHALMELFGIDHFLWLEYGLLEGDDTDGHIDTLARFCDTRTIAHVACHNSSDPHFKSIQRMVSELEQFRNRENIPYHLVPLPWPGAVFDEYGHRLPATYANFLIINSSVLVPQYNDPADLDALAVLKDCFPGREVSGVDCLPLIKQHGSLHCVTMQLPESVLESVLAEAVLT